MTDPRAGQPAQPGDLIDVAALVTAYYTVESRSGRARPAGRLRHLGTPRLGLRRRVQRGAHPGHHPGHLRVPRGAGLRRAAVHRQGHARACPSPAWTTALEVLVANDVTVLVDAGGRYTPTPAVSHAILAANRGKSSGPRRRHRRHPVAQPAARRRLQVQPAAWRSRRHRCHRSIAGRANELLRAGLGRRPPGADRTGAGAVESYDFLGTYVDDLPAVMDLDAIRAAGVRIGADPLGGASVDYWGAIAERHGLDLTVVNPQVDPTWRFMTLDWDGKIRMDCSSPSAMASLVGRKDEFQSPPETTPTPTGTASSPPTAG